MATVKQYGYYIEGNKVSVVQKDTNFDNDTNSKDFGPGSDKLQWKSPLVTVTDGLEIQYAYTPKYRINDLDDTVTGSAYSESSGLLVLTIPSSSFTAGDYIVIRGSERLNGLHKVKTTLSSGTSLELTTKYNGASVTESFTLHKDVDVLNDEDDEIDINPYLNKALVWYVKARFLEDARDIEGHEYYMRKFKKTRKQ
jgi:hypothetical protein